MRSAILLGAFVLFCPAYSHACSYLGLTPPPALEAYAYNLSPDGAPAELQKVLKEYMTDRDYTQALVGDICDTAMAGKSLKTRKIEINEQVMELIRKKWADYK